MLHLKRKDSTACDPTSVQFYDGHEKVGATIETKFRISSQNHRVPATQFIPVASA
jgi:hypothetical protein